jgi:NADPH:quinone reductase
MRAVRVQEFGGAEQLRLEEVPAPKVGAGQVLVRVHAVGVNPVDVYIRSGAHVVKPPLPYTPGMDAGGVVEEIGEGTTGLHAGDRVYVAGALSGTYAELTLCASHQVHPLPAHCSYAEGAGIGVPYATAYRALFLRARAVPGEVVLVHGATGGVGLAATQLARAAGMRVIGTGGTEEGRRLAGEQGAHEVLDHHAEGYLEKLMEMTDGRGVDVVLEMLANVNLNKDLEVLAKRGRVVVIGSRGTVEINPRLTMTRDASILGMSLINATQEEMTGIHAAIVAGLENRTLRPIVSRELPLADAAGAHTAVLEPGAQGKIVLIP